MVGLVSGMYRAERFCCENLILMDSGRTARITFDPCCPFGEVVKKHLETYRNNVIIFKCIVSYCYHERIIVINRKKLSKCRKNFLDIFK